MISLIKNELFKIFHKKSTYILLIIAILFSILNNFVYSYNNYHYYNDYDSTIKSLENEIDTLEKSNGSVIDIAMSKSQLDVQKQFKKYEDKDWKMRIIGDSYYEYSDNYYDALLVKKDDKLAKKYKEQMDLIIKNLDKDNWLYFAKIDLEQHKNELEELNVKLANSASNTEATQIKQSIELTEEYIALDEYRIANKCGYEGYLSDAIDMAKNTYESVIAYEYTKGEKGNENYEEDVKTYYENKYILDKKVDINNESTMQNVIKNLYYELSFIIFVFLIMIAGGIVSEEYNKGTIKNLLTIPHTRTKILLSKYITTLLMIPFIVLFILVVELIIGRLFFSYSTLSIPVIHYVLNTSSIAETNVFIYYFLIVATNLPYIVLLMTLAFSVSTVIGNTAFSIAITFAGYIGASLINLFASTYKIKLLNYFVTTNWDFSVHLFGGKSPYGISITQSIIVCLVYFLIMIITSFIVFNKKNIKNI